MKNDEYIYEKILTILVISQFLGPTKIIEKLNRFNLKFRFMIPVALQFLEAKFVQFDETKIGPIYKFISYV